MEFDVDGTKAAIRPFWKLPEETYEATIASITEVEQMNKFTSKNEKKVVLNCRLTAPLNEGQKLSDFLSNKADFDAGKKEYPAEIMLGAFFAEKINKGKNKNSALYDLLEMAKLLEPLKKLMPEIEKLPKEEADVISLEFLQKNLVNKKVRVYVELKPAKNGKEAWNLIKKITKFIE